MPYEFDEQGYPILGATPSPEQYKFDEQGYPILDAEQKPSPLESALTPPAEERPAEDVIDSLPHDKLMESERYRQVYGSAVPVLGEDKAQEYAKERVKADAQSIPFLRDGMFADMMGLPKTAPFDLHYGHGGGTDENPSGGPTTADELRKIKPPEQPGWESEQALDFGAPPTPTGPPLKESLAKEWESLKSATPRMLESGGAGLLKFGTELSQVGGALVGQGGMVEEEIAPIKQWAEGVQQRTAQESAAAVASGEETPTTQFAEALSAALFQLPEYALTPEIKGAHVLSAAVSALPASYASAKEKYDELEPKVGTLQALEAAGLTGVLNESIGALSALPGGSQLGQFLLTHMAVAGTGAIAAEEVGRVGENFILANHPELQRERDVGAEGRSALTMMLLPLVGKAKELPSKILQDRVASTLKGAWDSADTASALNTYSQVGYVVDTVRSGEKSSLWGLAELSHINKNGEVRDDDHFGKWIDKAHAEQEAQRAAAEEAASAQVMQPTAAETATPEARDTLEAAQALVGSPNAPTTAIDVGPLPWQAPKLPGEDLTKPERLVGAEQQAAEMRARVAQPVEEAPPTEAAPTVEQPPAREGLLPADFEARVAQAQEKPGGPFVEEPPPAEAPKRAGKVTPEMAAEAVKRADIEQAHVQREEEQQAAGETGREEGLQEARLRNEQRLADEATARARGEAPPQPTAMELAFQKAKDEEAPPPAFSEEEAPPAEEEKPAAAPEGKVPNLPAFRNAEGAPETDNGITRGLPAEKTNASQALEDSINHHFAKPGGPQASFEEVRRDSLPDAVARAFKVGELFTGNKIAVVRETSGVRGEVGPKFSGVTLREGVLYVHEQAAKPLMHIISHEWSHQLETSAPHLYAKLSGEVKRQGRLDEYQKHLEDNGQVAARRAGGALSELTANAVGDSMGDHTFMTRMAGENPILFRGIAGAYKRYLDRFIGENKDLGSNRFMTDVTKFRDVLADVLHQHASERFNIKKPEGERAPSFREEGMPPPGQAPPAQYGVSDQEISTRNPTAPKRTEDPLKQQLLTGLDAAKMDPKRFQKLVDVMDRQGFHRELGADATPEERVEHIINFLKDNIVWLHNQMPEDIRDRAKLWYVGAHEMAKNWAEEYGVDRHAVAGILARFSPEKDWFLNVSQGKRVIDFMSKKDTHEWDPRMEEALQGMLESDRRYDQPKLDIVGKKFSELTDPIERALWFRAHDRVFHDQTFEVVHPEGDLGDFVRNKAKKGEDLGVPSRGSFAKLNEIYDAMSMYENPTRENISNLLGEGNKIRNFYNNIESPNSPHGHTTVDTHAVAADTLLPLSGTSDEVMTNFGGPGSKITGDQGTYSIHHEAYRRAAEEIGGGILPREVQSITWEAIRGLFPRAEKGKAKGKAGEKVDTLLDKARAIWQNYKTGGASLDETRSAILELGGGIRAPAWHAEARPDLGVPRKAGYTSDARGVDQSELGGRSPGAIERGGRTGVAAATAKPVFSEAERAAGRPDEGRNRRAGEVGREPWTERPAREHSLQVDGVHYSNTAGLTQLNGRKYGTQHAGAESVRLGETGAIRNRVYFYPSDSPLATRGESVVGRAARYDLKLGNIYDARTDPLDLRDKADVAEKRGKNWHNAFEREVVKAGFDGYRTHDMGVVLDSKRGVDTGAPRPLFSEEGTAQENTPEFKRWFGSSKVVSDGKPVRLYTGTSKDVDFKAFKVPKSGVWLTSDPKEASAYALDNDSQNLRYNSDTRTYDRVHTSSRVIPVFARIEKPYTLTSAEMEKMRYSQNYKREQGILFDSLRMRGYDGVDMGGGTWVVLRKPEQIKSAIANRGTFEEKPHIAFSEEENVAPHSDETGDGEPVKSLKTPIGTLRVETAKGQTRSGPGWSREMKHDYGYIEGVPGRDGGSMDAIIGEGARNPMRPVFVIHQKNAEGGFDEHKVMVGFANQRDAERAYKSEYPKGWDRMGQVEQFTSGGFKQWAKTEGREQAQIGKVDPSVPRFQARPLQHDAVSMHATTSNPMPVRTSHEGAALDRLDLPNAPKTSQARTHFDDASNVTGTHQVVLRNLYDVNSDPRDLFTAAVKSAQAKGLPLDEPHVANELENHIAAAGFDGYRSRDGKAVVLGGKVKMEKAHEGEPVAAGRPVEQPAAGRERAEAPTEAPRPDVTRAAAGPREDHEVDRTGEGDQGPGKGPEEGEGKRVPGGPPREAADQDVDERTAIRNRATDEVRILRGAEPHESVGGRSVNEIETDAHVKLLENPNIGRAIAQEVAKKARNISDVEAAILAIDRQRIEKQHTEMAARVDKLMGGDVHEHALALAEMKMLEDAREANERASKNAGTEWSNSGRARNLAVKKDESLVSLLTKQKIAAGRDLNETERKSIGAQADEIEKLKQQIESPGLKKKPEIVENAAKAEFSKALDELKKMSKDEMMTKECFL